MALSKQPYKGARDFYPEDKRLQNYLFGVMRKVVEKFGYEEYDAPILEPIELYMAKTGQEIVDEQTYLFEDRGGRKVAIRPEITPTVSRMVAARRQELAYPLRLYSIPNLWRYERPQRGRLREHWQLNVDLFGIADIEAEHEILVLIDELMQAYGAKRHMYTIKLNSRKLVEYVLHDYLGLGEVQAQTLIRLIDHMHKTPKAEFSAQMGAILTPTQREDGTETKLQDILSIGHMRDLADEVYGHDSIKELKGLMKLLQDSGIKNIEFDITLMRGFDYYTDIVFEVFDNDPENSRAIVGGGRYDGLVGLFGVENLPTIGFGAGDVGLKNFLETHKLVPALPSQTDAYVVILGDIYNEAQQLIMSLRKMGLNIAVDMSGRKPAAQIKSAVKKGIAYAVFVGQKELDDKHLTVKNLQTGEEKQMSVPRAVSILKDYRNK